LDNEHYKISLSLFSFFEGELFPAKVALSWCRSELWVYCLDVLWGPMTHTFIQKRKFGRHVLSFESDIQMFIFGR
jgi:hypothetical protein